MGWTLEVAKALEVALNERGLSYRDVANKIGHSYNYWWQRIGARTTKLSLENIEALCGLLGEDPQKFIGANHRK